VRYLFILYVNKIYSMKYGHLFLLLVVIPVLMLVSGCTDSDVGTDDLDDSTILGDAPQDVGDADGIVKQPKQLTEFQAEACNAAHEAGTCDTRLKQLGIVSKDDCCSSLSKCC